MGKKMGFAAVLITEMCGSYIGITYTQIGGGSGTLGLRLRMPGYKQDIAQITRSTLIGIRVRANS